MPDVLTPAEREVVETLRKYLAACGVTTGSGPAELALIDRLVAEVERLRCVTAGNTQPCAECVRLNDVLAATIRGAEVYRAEMDRLAREVERLDALTLEPQCEGCGVYVAPDPTTPDGRGHQVPNEDGSPGFCGPVTSVGRAFACVRGCDAEVAVDEDGCCVTCGGDTIPVTGTPSERRVLLDIVSDLLASECNSWQDVAKDEMASLRARNEALERLAQAAAAKPRTICDRCDDGWNEPLNIALSALNDGSGGAP